PVPQHLDPSPESVDHFYTDMLRLGQTERHRGPIAEWIALDHAQMERVARGRDGFAHLADRAAPLGQPAGRHRSRTDEAPSDPERRPGVIQIADRDGAPALGPRHAS